VATPRRRSDPVARRHGATRISPETRGAQDTRGGRAGHRANALAKVTLAGTSGK
jgi:hypothetical protein